MTSSRGLKGGCRAVPDMWGNNDRGNRLFVEAVIWNSGQAFVARHGGALRSLEEHSLAFLALGAGGDFAKIPAHAIYVKIPNISNNFFPRRCRYRGPHLSRALWPLGYHCCDKQSGPVQMLLQMLLPLLITNVVFDAHICCVNISNTVNEVSQPLRLINVVSIYIEKKFVFQSDEQVAILFEFLPKSSRNI